MLVAKKIQDYYDEYNPTWCLEMPDNCPPENIEIPFSHIFYRLAINENTIVDDDWKTYSEMSPNKDWGEQLPLAKGLSLINNEAKAKRMLKLPSFKGIIELNLNPHDGVVKQTGAHNSHYTWWNTVAFDKNGVKILQL